ncbi:hypothetical protein Dimus_029768 [Dionaea muscipula]
MGSRSISSHAGARSGGEEEDDLDDGFSELEGPENLETLQGTLTDDDKKLVSEPELSDDDEGEESLEKELISDPGGDDISETLSQRNRFSSSVFKAIMDNQSQRVYKTLDKYVADGKDLSRSEISDAMICLRKRKMYSKALQFYEWLEANKQMEFLERDYVHRLDLIAKVRGLQIAENYINSSIPEPYRGELVYRSLLANCISSNDVKKAGEVFNRMKDLDNITVKASVCNQLLLFYKKAATTKIADVLLFMEKEHIKPTPHTYYILVDTKGESNDMDGMDQIVETMKAEGMEPDLRMQVILAKHYAAGGLKEKAEAILKGIEGSNLERGVCEILLPVYADLGNVDQVRRVWDICKTKPTREECMAAIKAWGRLKKIEEAESVFDHMVQTWKGGLSSRHYVVLLNVYADHKMLSKGKDLVRKMGESGCRIGSLTWHALVKLYVEAGEVEKADAVLQKAIQQNIEKPMFSSFLTVMEQYAKRGDIHNSEKTFYRMRQAGYVPRALPFQILLQAYVNAKSPAYGFRERMKAENVFPNRAVADQLAQINAFTNTAASALLD